MIHLWKSYHHTELVNSIRQHPKGETLVLIPPHLKAHDIAPKLFANRELNFLGDLWTDSEKTEFHSLYKNKALHKSSEAYDFGLFSSGTSDGQNKLIFFQRENIEHSIEGILSLFDRKRIKKIFCYPHPFHTFGFCLGYYLAAFKNLALAPLKGKYSKTFHSHWLNFVDQNTLSLGAPVHFIDLMASTETKPPQSYSCIVGGAPVSRHLWKKIQGDLQIEAPSIGYGATEACPGITHLEPGVEPPSDSCIGRALPGVSIRLIEEKGVEFSGPNLCTAVNTAFDSQHPKIVLLKDQLKLNASGHYSFHGRYDFLLNRGAQKFSLEKVESLLEEHFATPFLALKEKNARLGEDLLLACRSDHSIEKMAIADFIHQKLGFKLNTENIFYLSSIPLNPNGKKMRHFTREALKEKAFPLSIERVAKFLPHREPAIWIDEIKSAHEKGGECVVRLEKNKNYFDSRSKIRESSYLEWTAQAYGYCLAAFQNIQLNTLKPGPQIEKAFLASCDKLEVLENHINETHTSLNIQVECVNSFPPLSIVEGVISTNDGQQLARSKIKLYAQQNDT